ncbi:hypothetical protein LA03_04760, partial [Burkholderia gladioli]
AFRREAAWVVAKHHEAVQMAVLDRAEVVYLAREDPSRAVRLVSDIGSRLPAHSSALGKALLASLDDETVQMIMPARLRALTEHSLTRRADLLAALAEVRERAYAIEREEACTGLACLAVFVGVSSGREAWRQAWRHSAAALSTTRRHSPRATRCASVVRSTSSRVSRCGVSRSTGTLVLMAIRLPAEDTPTNTARQASPVQASSRSIA